MSRLHLDPPSKGGGGGGEEDPGAGFKAGWEPGGLSGWQGVAAVEDGELPAGRRKGGSEVASVHLAF